MKEKLNKQVDYLGAIFFISASFEKISLAKTIADIIILSYSFEFELMRKKIQMCISNLSFVIYCHEYLFSLLHSAYMNHSL